MEPQHPSYRENLNATTAQRMINEAHAYANAQRDRVERLEQSRASWRAVSLILILLFGVMEPLLRGLTLESRGPEPAAIYVDAGHESVSGVEIHVVPAYCHLIHDPRLTDGPFGTVRCELFPNALFSVLRPEPPRAICAHGQYCPLHRICPRAPHWHPVHPLIPDLHLSLSP